MHDFDLRGSWLHERLDSVHEEVIKSPRKVARVGTRHYNGHGLTCRGKIDDRQF